MEIDQEAGELDAFFRFAGVEYRCELQSLIATFQWSPTSNERPQLYWLELSLFKDIWDQNSSWVRQVRLDQDATSVNVSLDVDSVYYWRMTGAVNGREVKTAIRAIETPSCAADFVDDD